LEQSRQRYNLLMVSNSILYGNTPPREKVLSRQLPDGSIEYINEDYEVIRVWIPKGTRRFFSGEIRGEATIWLSTGRPHRDPADGPAVLFANGGVEYWQYGQRHRPDDLPAVIRADGTQVWYQHGQLHRPDNPAVITLEGDQFWYLAGEEHRDPADGPAAQHADGSQEYFVHGNRHRDDGPALICKGKEGFQRWYQHGRIYRDPSEGPAIINDDGREIWAD